MRIGFVSVQDAYLPSTWSGIPLAILRQLESEGHEIVPITPLSRNFRYLFLPKLVLAKLTGASAAVDRHPIALWSYARQIHQRIQTSDVDVIFAPSSVPVTSLKCRQPVVYWTDAVWHSFYGYYPVNVTPEGDRLAREQEVAALKRTTFAVYSSEWAAKSAVELLGSGSKVRVLHFGPNLPIQHSGEDVNRWTEVKVAPRQSPLKLLFIGVGWQRKGGATAVEVTRILNERGINSTLTVVGSDPEGPVPSFVDCRGFISKATEQGRSQLAQLYQESDFFILPTQAEASAVVYAEASAFGLPILTYETGGVGDYVRTGVNGFALSPQCGPQNFADAAADVIGDPNRYRELARGAYAEYEKRLNWQVSVRKLLDLFRDALGTASTGHKS